MTDATPPDATPPDATESDSVFPGTSPPGPADDVRSAFQKLVNYRVVEVREGYARVELDLDERHINRNGVLHGGALTTLIDVAGGRCGTFCSVPGHHRRGVTVSLTTGFHRGVRHGRLIAEARQMDTGTRRIYTATIEVRNEAGLLVGTGHGTYKYMRGSEKPEGVPIKPAP